MQDGVAVDSSGRSVRPYPRMSGATARYPAADRAAKLVPPRRPALGKAVAQDDERSIALFGHVHADAVDLDEPMLHVGQLAGQGVALTEAVHDREDTAGQRARRYSRSAKRTGDQEFRRKNKRLFSFGPFLLIFSISCSISRDLERDSGRPSPGHKTTPGAAIEVGAGKSDRGARCSVPRRPSPRALAAMPLSPRASRNTARPPRDVVATDPFGTGLPLASNTNRWIPPLKWPDKKARLPG